MTPNEVIEYVRTVAHRNASSNDQTEQIKDAIEYGLMRWSGFTTWWFMAVELKMQIVAGKRLYDWPATDISGNAIRLANYDPDSFRSKAVTEYAWLSRQDISEVDPEWSDQEDVDDPSAPETGSTYAITQVGQQLALYPTPSVDFQAANPFLYFDGWREMLLPGDAAFDWDAEIQDVPTRWHGVLKELALAETYRQARNKEWKASYQVGEDDLQRMQRRCLPTVGPSRGSTPPAPQFRPRGRRGGRRRNSDYGRLR